MSNLRHRIAFQSRVGVKLCGLGPTVLEYSMSALETLLSQYRTVSLTNSQELYPESEGQGLPLIQVKSPLRSEEHTSELQSRGHLVCRLLLEKKKQKGTS